MNKGQYICDGRNANFFLTAMLSLHSGVACQITKKIWGNLCGVGKEVDGGEEQLRNGWGFWAGGGRWKVASPSLFSLALGESGQRLFYGVI